MTMKRALLLMFAITLALAALLPLAGCNSLKENASTATDWTQKNAAAAWDWVKENDGIAAAAVGTAWTAKQLQYLKPEFLAAGLIAYGIYDPFAPTWEIRVTELDPEHCRIDLNMKRLTTGGDGEARRIFVRVARSLMERGGFADFDELHYEEGIESTRPFAHRVAEGEIRLVKSRQFPGW
jgi:hypothetical protein